MWAQSGFDGNSEKGIVIWKAHHSLADGMSSMGLNLQLDETYDTKKLLKFPTVPFIIRLMYRLAVPFFVPFILLDGLRNTIDSNPLHDGKRELTGKK